MEGEGAVEVGSDKERDQHADRQAGEREVSQEQARWVGVEGTLCIIRRKYELGECAEM